MADVFHIHGNPKCKVNPTRHHPSCPTVNWSWACTSRGGGRYGCIHLDPSAPGTARLVRVFTRLGIKLYKGGHAHAAKKSVKKRRRW